MKNTLTINDLYKVLLKAWSKDTAYPGDKDRWSEEKPATGQCAVTALVVQDIFGGEIYRGVGDKSHYWNVVSGAVVDLTESQFSTPPAFTKISVVSREQLLKSPDTRKRYDTLKAAVSDIDKSFA